MRKFLPLTVIFRRNVWGRAVMLSIAAAMLAGCPNPEAQERHRVGQELDKALVLYHEAEQGFDASDASAPDASELRLVRQDRLQKTQSALEAIRGKGSDAQKVAILRLLADVYEANARFHQEQALSNWAALANQETVMLGHFTAADRAQSRADASRFDGPALLAKVESERHSAEQHLAQLRSRAADLTAQSAALQSQIQGLVAQRDQLTAEALRLKQEAFVAAGDEQFNLSEQSAKMQRQADALDAQIQERQVGIDQISAEMAVVSEETRLTQENLESILTSIAEISQRSLASQQAIDSVQGEAQDAQRNVLRGLAQLNEAYDAGVEAEFRLALEQIDEAVEALRQSQAFTRGDTQRAGEVRMELARKQISKVNLLTDRVVAYAEHGAMLAMVEANAPRVLPDHAATIREEFKSVQDRAAAMTSEAQEAIVQGLELAGQINVEEERAQGLELLAAYRTRVEKATVEALPATFTPTLGPAPRGAGGAAVMGSPVEGLAGATRVAAVPVAAIAGELPPLPEVATSDQFAGFVVIDGTLLTPASLRGAAAAMMGQAGAMLEQPFGQFDAMYGAISEMGLKGLVIALPADAAGEPTVFVGSDEPLNLENVRAMMVAGGASPEFEIDENNVTALDRWTAISPQGVQLPGPGDAARRQVVQAAMASVPQQAITLVLAPSEEARQMALQMMDGGAEQAETARLITEKATWLALGVNLGDAPTISARIKMATAADAAQIKAQIDKTMDPSQADPNDMMAGMLAQAPDAIVIALADDVVQIDVDGKKLRPVIEGAMMMFMMMQQAPAPGISAPGMSDPAPGMSDPEMFPTDGGMDEPMPEPEPEDK